MADHDKDKAAAHQDTRLEYIVLRVG